MPGSPRITDRLFEPVDNSPLIAFRVFFGAVLLCECAGAVATGWVTATFVDAPFTMSVIGFDWVPHVPSRWIYAWYLGMAGLAGLVMLGAATRWSLGLLTLTWGATHVMQICRYNNHHYLMLLVCALLLVCPADRRAAIDLRRRPERRRWTCPRWCLLLFAVQMSIVYIYGGVAKLDADWLAGRPLAIWFAAKADHPALGWFLTLDWVPRTVAWAGLIFDLAIVPLLVWRRTRVAAIVATAVFHTFNAVTFGVGMFPVLGFGFALFFVEPETVRRWIFRRPTAPEPAEPPTLSPARRRLVLAGLSVFLLFQLLFPLRHWLWEGHPSWTEEGHRMAWRMMLRAKAGEARFEVVDSTTGERWDVDPADHLSPLQSGSVATLPAAAWQFVRYLDRRFAERGHVGVRIYVHARVSLNGRPHRPLIDSRVDLAKEPWPWFGHAHWIVPLPR